MVDGCLEFSGIVHGWFYLVSVVYLPLGMWTCSICMALYVDMVLSYVVVAGRTGLLATFLP